MYTVCHIKYNETDMFCQSYGIIYTTEDIAKKMSLINTVY